MKEWTKEICAERPELLQRVAPDIYIERKDIVSTYHQGSDGMPGYTDYECLSREISVSEYNLLKDIANISTQEAVDSAIDAYTEQLIEEGIL